MTEKENKTNSAPNESPEHNSISCCYLFQILEKMEFGKGVIEVEAMKEIIWEKLEKENKLCKKCSSTGKY